MRQDDLESSSPQGTVFHHGPSPMRGRDLGHDRKTEAGASPPAIPGLVEPGEPFEHGASVFARNPRPVVVDLKNDFTIRLL